MLHACKVPPDAGLQKKANFSTQIVGLFMTVNITWAICMVGSSTNRKAIHYDTFKTSSELDIFY
jgi:hypothetical protein